MVEAIATRICLVNPPVLLPRGGHSDVYEPLGLAYLAAVLREPAGYDVKIIDAVGLGYNAVNRWENANRLEGRLYLGLSYRELVREIKGNKPEIVGISIPFSTQALSALHLVTLIKESLIGAHIMVGGPHASVKPVECVRAGADIAVIGEGEQTVRELAKKIEDGDERLDDVKGIAYVREKDVKVTSPRPPIRELDNLPFPARDLLPMENYFKVRRERGVAMITSRGCPYHCSFCSVHLTMGRLWRARSPSNVVNEIEELIEKYRIKRVFYEDDNISLDRNRMAKICELLIRRKLKIQWELRNGIRADTLTEKLLVQMKEAGCKRLCVAPESGDQETVNRLVGKNLDLVKVEEAVALCKKVGIIVDAFFVIGLAGENKASIRRSLDFAHKLRVKGARHCFFFTAKPYYGTELYSIATREGYLLKDGIDLELGNLDGQPLIETAEFTPKDIASFQAQATKEEHQDYLNPAYFVSQLRGILHDRRESMLIAYSSFKRTITEGMKRVFGLSMRQGKTGNQ